MITDILQIIVQNISIMKNNIEIFKLNCKERCKIFLYFLLDLKNIDLRYQ